MKRILLYFAVMTLLFCACDASLVPMHEDRIVEVCLAAKSMSDGDVDMSRADIFVFRSSDGTLLGRTHADGGGMGVIPIPETLRTDYFAIVNAPEGLYRQVRNLDDFISTPLSLGDCAPREGSFVMTGHGSGAFDASNNEASLYVERLSCKVSVGKITVSFPEPCFNGTVTIDSLYLINVLGSIPLSMKLTEDLAWFNRMGADDRLDLPLRNILEESIGIEVTSADPVEVNKVFYCLPNPVESDVWSDTSPSWTPRHTRLVAVFSINGVKNYYPVTLPVMKANREYRINNLRLLGSGGSHPDEPVCRDSISYNIQIADWVENAEVDIMF